MSSFIFKIPIHYIGFRKEPRLEYNLRFNGFKNIHHFVAVDGRKYKPLDLLNSKIINVRAYNDLIYGRDQHIGISSLGTIGCTLSHLAVWKICVRDNLPFIAVAENDLKLNILKPQDIKNIENALRQKNGGFISSDIKKGSEILFNAHFYILSNGAAKELINQALPISMQTDSYIGHMNNIGKINLEGYVIGKQIQNTKSSTRDSEACIKCWLPRSKSFYIFLYLIITIIIVTIVAYIIKRRCQKCPSKLSRKK